MKKEGQRDRAGVNATCLHVARPDLIPVLYMVPKNS